MVILTLYLSRINLTEMLAFLSTELVPLTEPTKSKQFGQIRNKLALKEHKYAYCTINYLGHDINHRLEENWIELLIRRLKFVL